MCTSKVSYIYIISDAYFLCSLIFVLKFRHVGPFWRVTEMTSGNPDQVVIMVGIVPDSGITQTVTNI